MHVIQQRLVSDGMYKPGVVVSVCTVGVSYLERSWKAKKSWKGSASNIEVGALRGQEWAIPDKDKIKYVYGVRELNLVVNTQLHNFYGRSFAREL